MTDIPPSTISWIGSLQIWLTMVGGVFSGRLLDAGYFVPSLFVGAVLQVLGIFLMSISTKYWQLMLTQGFLTGLGGGIFFTPSLALVSTVSVNTPPLSAPSPKGGNKTSRFALWASTSRSKETNWEKYFDARRGLALGLATTGNAAGGIIYPVIVRQLMPKLGYGWTARVLGFLNLGCLAICVVFMRPRLPPRKSGPLVDWSAFKELVYDLFVAAWWFAMWANYYTFYYVSASS